MDNTSNDRQAMSRRDAVKMVTAAGLLAGLASLPEEASASTLYQGLKDVVQDMEIDVEKFYMKNNKAAGNRVRKACDEIINLAKNLKNDVNVLKQSM